MRAKCVFGRFQHIQQDIGFIRGAVGKNLLGLGVGHLSCTCELPVQERISRHLQRIGDANKSFETHNLCTALEIADVSSGLVDHGGQHRLGDTLVLPDFLDSLTKDIVIELHRETSLKILATQLYLNHYFIAVRLYKLDLRILYTNLNYSR